MNIADQKASSIPSPSTCISPYTYFKSKVVV